MTIKSWTRSIHTKQVGLLAFLLFFSSYKLVSQTFLFFKESNYESIRIPYREVGGLMLIDVHINQIPLSFIFDTGAQQNVLLKDDLKILLGLRYERTIHIHGSDLSKPLRAYLTRVKNLALDEKVSAASSLIVLDDDILGLDRLLGTPVEGILGSTVFSNSVLHINNSRRYIKLIPHEKFDPHPRKGYYYFPISIDQGRPFIYTYISVKGEKPRLFRLLLDTGSSIPLLLYANDSLGIEMPDEVIVGHLGSGLGGELKGYIGKVNSLAFGEYEFNNFPASFQVIPDSSLAQEKTLEDRHGILGNGILDRFNYYIDYYNELIYMKPRRNIKSRFLYDRSGLSLVAGGPFFEHVIVEQVIEGSPADEVGIQKGDRILRIQGLSTSFLKIPDIQRILAKKAGKKIRLVVEHQGVEIKKKIILRDLF